MKRRAVSTAVEPPVVKNTRLRSPGVRAAISRASLALGELVLLKGEK